LVSTIVQVLTSLFLIAVVLLQSGKRSGLSGAIAGAAESFMAKNKARTWDARLARVTKWVAALFLLLTLVLNLFPTTPPAA
jgi:preprotein translocase subunit SecG